MAKEGGMSLWGKTKCCCILVFLIAMGWIFSTVFSSNSTIMLAELGVLGIIGLGMVVKERHDQKKICANDPHDPRCKK